MANAFYAESGGVSSIHYNPAGTAFSKNLEITGNLGMPHTGLETVNLQSFNSAFIFPFTKHFAYAPIFENTVIAELACS